MNDERYSGLTAGMLILREQEYHFPADQIAMAIEELRNMREIAHKFDTGYIKAQQCSNPDCPLERAHPGPCAPKDFWFEQRQEDREYVFGKQKEGNQ